jgi:LacI family transcriptional regulator
MPSLNHFTEWCAVTANVRHGVKDVARSAGVSPATVSRYLNGSLQLPTSTRHRIDKAVDDLDYRPNPHARRLSLGRSDTLALLLPDIANPFFARLAAAVAAAATERGISVALQGTDNDVGRELRALDHAHRNLVDGVVFATNQTASPKVAKALRRFERAVVLDGEVEGANAPGLTCANEQGGFLAGRCLRGRGHRRVAYLGGPSELRSTRARLAGLRRGIGGGSDADVPIRTYSEDHAAASGRAAVSRFLDERDGETALFVGSDELLVGVLEMFRARGIRVPDDISLISFDGVRSLHLFDPAITTVVQPVDALGRRAVEMLLDGPWDDQAFRASRERLPVTLIERASVAPPASPP